MTVALESDADLRARIRRVAAERENSYRRGWEERLGRAGGDKLDLIAAKMRLRRRLARYAHPAVYGPVLPVDRLWAEYLLARDSLEVSWDACRERPAAKSVADCASAANEVSRVLRAVALYLKYESQLLSGAAEDEETFPSWLGLHGYASFLEDFLDPASRCAARYNGHRCVFVAGHQPVNDEEDHADGRYVRWRDSDRDPAGAPQREPPREARQMELPASNAARTNR